VAFWVASSPSRPFALTSIALAIEARAIQSVFFPDGKDGQLLVGSIKTVIGHTEGTAGVAGVLKASLAVQHGQIPANLHFNKLNPKIRPFYNNLRIPTETIPWPDIPQGSPRRVSVNSFGFGGTNAHAIIESWDGPGALVNGHASNGITSNGHAVNGHSLNGHGANGHALNGHAENGSTLNGHALNGHKLNGHSLKAHLAGPFVLSANSGPALAASASKHGSRQARLHSFPEDKFPVPSRLLWHLRGAACRQA